MDTSETYIKMRLAAIPDLGYGVEFTRYTLNDYVGPLNLYIDAKGDVYYLAKFTETQDWCQLERQDQLQEMIGGYDEALALITDWGFEMQEPSTVANKLAADTFRQFTSMEQLWLAFYQHEVNSKTWDGAKWV